MNKMHFGIQKGTTVNVKLSLHLTADDSPVSLANQTVHVRLVKVDPYTNAEEELLQGTLTNFTGPSNSEAIFAISHTTTTGYEDIKYGYVELVLETASAHTFKTSPLYRPTFRIGQKVPTNFDGKLPVQGKDDNLYFKMEDDIQLPLPNSITGLNGQSFTGLNGLTFDELNGDSFQQ